MRSLVVFDSCFGNTERIARAIGDALAAYGASVVVPVAEASAALTAKPELLVVGGPTQRHRLSPALEAFLKGLRRRSLSGVATVAFDTRYRMRPALTGSAAVRIHQLLRRADGRAASPPESFFMAVDRPPKGQKRRHELEVLEPGELGRAVAWTERLGRSLAGAVAPSGG